MGTFSFFQRLARTHPWGILGGLTGVALAAFGLCRSLGYRLPGADHHPDWAPFPALSNPRLAVERIANADFAARYGRRFPYPAEADSTGNSLELYEHHRANLRNVRVVGFQVTENEFRRPFYRLFYWPSPTGQGTDADPVRTGFYCFGYEYLKLSLGAEQGFFKEEIPAATTALADFYQYNYPATRRDTLFLRHDHTNYRVYLR